MQISKSTKKTKKFLKKTIKTLTSFFSDRYQNLPKSPSLNPLASCSKNPPQDELCTIMTCDFKADLDKNTSAKVLMVKKQGHEGIIPGPNNNGGSRSGYILAEKMKELEMMEEGDIEHAVDVEEALHYYSRLRSPVYLDIVDNFFMDMYSEFNKNYVPHPSLSISNSRRRKGSFRF